MDKRRMTLWNDGQIMVENYHSNPTRWYKRATPSSRRRFENLANSKQYPLTVFVFANSNCIGIAIDRKASNG